jgi:pimeloyl-ACP methyl ester carboxylesterase
MLNFLMSPFAPYVIAACVAAVGLFVWRARLRATGPRRSARTAFGGFCLGLGALLAFGASAALYQQAHARSQYAPPGKMVQVADRTLHVWCAGPKSAQTVLLLGGGHSQGLWMRPFQAGLRDQWRACLIDRAGLGWSGAGRTPITLDDEIAQLHDGLAVAGEHPASALVGHSGGGEVAINYAGAYPEEVKALVLLDPSSPMYSVVDWRGSGLKVRVEQWWPVFATMFGLATIDTLNPLRQPKMSWLRDVFGEYWDAGVTWETRTSSIVEDLSAHEAVRADPFSIVRTPGALPNQKLLLITQTPDAPRPPPGVTGRRATNYANLINYARREPLFLAPHSQLLYAPADASHYFLYTQESFTLTHIHEFLHRELQPEHE